MKISTKLRYGLRILLQIALDTEYKNSVTAHELAKKQDISEPYLEQIMITMKNSGFVNAIRGCRGGYVLNQSPKEITVLDVLELFEGKVKLVDCIDKNKPCSRLDFCCTHEIWEDLSNVIKEKASEITLESIIIKIKQKQQKMEYII